MKRTILAALALLCVASTDATWPAPVQAQAVSPEELARRTIERRAVEAAIWGMPAVNFDLMYQALITAGGKDNQVVYWSQLPDWKNQTLTPNPDVIYLMPFFDTKDVGPMVMEIPPAGPDGSITGSIDDGWQTALEDVGPAGVDKGEGGKYLILPPGYKENAPDGYIALQSPTYRSYALLRSNVVSGSDADIAKAVEYGKRVKSTPCRRPAARRPPNSSMQSTSSTTAPFPTGAALSPGHEILTTVVAIPGSAAGSITWPWWRLTAGGPNVNRRTTIGALLVGGWCAGMRPVAQPIRCRPGTRARRSGDRRVRRRVTEEGGPDFVPASERIATFDNDGTLWAEQPIYFQLAFAIDRVRALAPQHPEWRDTAAVQGGARGRPRRRWRRPARKACSRSWRRRTPA